MQGRMWFESMQMLGVLFSCFPDRLDAIMRKLMADEVTHLPTACIALCLVLPVRSRCVAVNFINKLASCVTPASTGQGHPRHLCSTVPHSAPLKSKMA